MHCYSARRHTASVVRGVPRRQDTREQIGERLAHHAALELEAIRERLGLLGLEALEAAREVAHERLRQQDMAHQRVNPRRRAERERMEVRELFAERPFDRIED